MITTTVSLHRPDVADAVVVYHGVVGVDCGAARVAGARVELGAVGPYHADRLLYLKLDNNSD